MTYPLSVAMTPAYFDPEHMLLRAQLRCLSAQTVPDFDVWLIDPHFQKRKDVIPELAIHCKLDITHVPYWPNIRISKKLDCAVFNAAFCYSPAPKIARLSCWRFVRPTWVETMLSGPPRVNMDFYYHNIEPPAAERAHPESKHDTAIWKYDSDEVHWDAMPKRSTDPGASWGWTLDLGGKPRVQVVPDACYGNIMWHREQWLALNGTDEVFTNTEHPEDIDFDIRAANAGQKVIRHPHLMYRLHHDGGTARCGKVPFDVPWIKPCPGCEWALNQQPPVRYSIENRRTLYGKGEIEVFPEQGVWVCRSCALAGPIWHRHIDEFMGQTRATKRTQARCVQKYMIGRNLRILSEDMDKVSLREKVALFNAQSHCSPRYYAA